MGVMAMHTTIYWEHLKRIDTWEQNIINMCLEEIWCDIHLIQDRVQWLALVNMVRNFRVP
jgi:hypothetical protein